MKKYVKPAIAMLQMRECLLNDMSTHDEIGDGNQLGKSEQDWTESESGSQSRSIWSDDEE